MDNHIYSSEQVRQIEHKVFAKNIVNRIVDKTILLESHPEIGQIEELLIGRREEYRSLIEGNYKIIYWIDGSYVRIATVFDCRQNPKKIKN